jgi:hypothetical protein
MLRIPQASGSRVEPGEVGFTLHGPGGGGRIAEGGGLMAEGFREKKLKI